jgi:hypothetical protein
MDGWMEEQTVISVGSLQEYVLCVYLGKNETVSRMLAYSVRLLECVAAEAEFH